MTFLRVKEGTVGMVRGGGRCQIVGGLLGLERSSTGFDAGRAGMDVMDSICKPLTLRRKRVGGEGYEATIVDSFCNLR